MRHIVLVGEQLKSQKESRQRIVVEAIYKDTAIKKFSKWEKNQNDETYQTADSRISTHSKMDGWIDGWIGWIGR